MTLIDVPSVHHSPLYVFLIKKSRFVDVDLDVLYRQIAMTRECLSIVEYAQEILKEL